MKIHGHPQKSDYASPSEWPKIPFQGHWQPANATVPLPPGESPILGHLHVELTFPMYGEWTTERLTIPFTLKLFHFAGHIADVYAGIDHGHSAVEIMWDATGTTTPPAMVGDIHGVKEWSGHFVVDNDPAFPHGWTFIAMSALAQADNGDSARVNAMGAMWSMLDPSVSSDNQWYLPLVCSRVTSHSPRRPEVLTGFNQMDVASLLPLASIQDPWPLKLSCVQYGGQSKLPIATFEMRLDMDLHNGIPGTLLQQVVDPPDGSLDVVLDPKVIGQGHHKIGLFFIQPLGGIEAVSSVLTFDLTVGDVPPPMLVTVPNVVGQSQTAASATLAGVGLTAMVHLTPDPAPEGTVLSQSPLAGASVPVGSAVMLMVASAVAPPHESMRPVGLFQLLDANGQPVNRFFACFDDGGAHEVCAELMVKP